MTTKIPIKWPTFIVKAMWASTAVTLKVRAANPDDAIDKAMRQLKHHEGWPSCEEVKIIGVK